MPPRRTAEYREKVRETLSGAIERLESKKITERKAGLEEIKEIFSHDAAVELLEPEDGPGKKDGSVWLTVFQAMFNAIVEERRTYLKGKNSTLAINRLGQFAHRLRWLVGRALHKLKKKPLRALITHLVQGMVEKGTLIEPLVSEYAPTLRLILSNSAHLAQLPPETWTEIMVMSFAAVLGDPIPRALDWSDEDASLPAALDSETDSSESKAGQKRRRLSPEASFLRGSSNSNALILSPEQAHFIPIIHILIRAPNAPLIPLAQSSEESQSQATEPSGTDPLFTARVLLSKFRRFLMTYTTTTSAQTEVISALGHLLSELELNARDLLISFATDMMPTFLHLWRPTGTSQNKLKEALIVVMTVLVPFLLLRPEHHPESVALDIQSIVKQLEDGLGFDRTSGFKPLPLDVLQLGLFDASTDLCAFTTKTIRYGSKFDAHHVFMWTVLELHADCVLECLRRPLPPVDSNRESPVKKRRTTTIQRAVSGADPGDPLANLLKKSAGQHKGTLTLDGRCYRLQVLLLLISRYWNELPARQQSFLNSELEQLLNDEDASIQSFAFLCCAASLAHLSKPLPQTTPHWTNVWSLASRKITNPAVCRAACHAMHIALDKSVVDRGRVMKDIERVMSELVVQGPAQPYDSVCAFFTHALQLTRRDIHFHRLGFGERVLDWLIDCWESAVSTRASADSLCVSHTLELLTAICGLANVPILRRLHPPPESALADWLVERTRTTVIREYFLQSRIGLSENPAKGFDPLTPVEDTQISQTRSDDQGMPSSIALKASRFLLRNVEVLLSTWEAVSERTIQVGQARLALVQSVLALLFEATLGLNGIRLTIKSVQKAYSLTVRVISALADQSFKNPELSHIVSALDMITTTTRDNPYQFPFEALTQPGSLSGLLTSHRVQEHQRVAPSGIQYAQAVQSILWDELHKRVDITEIMDATQKLLMNLGSTSMSTAPADEDNFTSFDGDTPALSTAPWEMRITAMSAWARSCCQLLASPGVYISAAAKTLKGTDVILAFLLQEDQEERLFRLGPMVCQLIDQGYLELDTPQLTRLFDVFAVLSTPAYYHSEVAQTFLVSLLLFSMHKWLAAVEEDDGAEELASQVESLCCWLIGCASANRLASWRVREKLTLFLDKYATRDPSQAMFVGARQEEDEDVSMSDAENPGSSKGLSVATSMIGDVDARVRFRAAVSNAHILDSLVCAGLREAPAVWQLIYPNFSSRLDRYEHMMTRILSMGNILVINAELSRVPYWHIIEAGYHTDDYLTQSERVLDACALLLGMMDRAALFRAFAPSVASATANHKMEFLRLPPTLLGFQNRTQQVLESFPLIFPSYCIRLGNSAAAVLKQQFAKDYIQKSGLDSRSALVDIMPEVVGLAMGFFIDDNTRADDLRSVLSKEDDAKLEDLLSNLVSQVSDAEHYDFIRESWDRITFSILRRLEDVDCTEDGPIATALRTTEDEDAAKTFLSLTRLRHMEDYQMHPPLPPSLKAITVARTLKRLHHMVTVSKSSSPAPRVSQTGIIIHVMHQLFGAINSNPLLNERHRLVNALCFHVARHHRRMGDYTLLRCLVYGCIPLLRQEGLATWAQSIIDFAIGKYSDLAGPQLVGLPSMLSRIAQIASDFAQPHQTRRAQELGSNLLDWIEGRLLSFESDEQRAVIRPALAVWPRLMTDDPWADLPETMSSTVSQALSDPTMAMAKFRMSRKLGEIVASQMSEGNMPPFGDFWTLKASIPGRSDLEDGDVAAFCDLLSLTAGNISAVPDDPESTPTLALRYNILTPPPNVIDLDISAKQYLVLALHAMLSANSPRAIRLAYETLRAILAAGFSPQNVRGTPQNPSHIFLEITLLNKFRVPINVVPARSLDELTRLPASLSDDYTMWSVTLNKLFASVLSARDPFFGQLHKALEDITFGEEAFPILCKQLLIGTRSDPPAPRKASLSLYFTEVLSRKDTDLACHRSIVHLILNLRHHIPPGQHDPLSYAHWLDIDYLLLAKAASACGLYTTALLFLELASEDLGEDARAEFDASAEDILYTIYSHIDEPDGFYGVRNKDVGKFLIRRFAHEAQWDKAFSYHSAAYEAGEETFDNDLMAVRSLHDLGLHRMAMEVSASLPSAGSHQEASELTYSMGWRTDVWDLPSDDVSGRPNATLYAALQCVHREKAHRIVDERLRALLAEEISRLKAIGNEDMASIQESVRLLISLRDLQRFSGEDLERLCSEVAQNKLSPFVEFTDFETIMAARLSLIRSRRLQEERDMLGDLRSEPARKLAAAEVRCLVALNQSARENDHIQVALNCIQRARPLVDTPAGKFHLDVEFASVLWTQSEHQIAIQLLRDLMLNPPPDRELQQELPSLRSQLGEWISHAALERPLDIQERYFSRAAEDIRHASDVSPTEQANVYRRFASFCEQQYLAHIGSPDAALLRSTVEELKGEVDRMETDLKGTVGGGREWRDLEKHLRKARDEYRQYSTKYDGHVKASAGFLQLAIRHFSRSLVMVTSSDESAIVIRLCSLWFSNFRNDVLNKSVRSALVNIPSHKLIFISHQLSSRLCINDPHEGHITLQTIVERLSSEHIFHVFYQLFALTNGKGSMDVTSRRASRSMGDLTQSDDDREQAALRVIQRLRADPKTQSRAKDLEMVCAAYLDWAKLKLQKVKPGTIGKIPESMRIARLRDVKVPIATDYLPVDPTGLYSDFVYLKYYESEYTTAGGINLPKITTCVGSDGVARKQLFKGQGDDDMRQDAVMEQVFDLVNYLLDRDRQTRKRRLCIRTYKVLPLAPQAGLLEFVPHTIPLKEYLDKGHALYRPKDMADADAAKFMIHTRDHRQNLFDAYNKVCNRLKPVMRHWFTESSRLPMGWYAMRLNYSRSVATTSIVGHIIGLGDRHTSNILLEKRTGEVVHIDLGIAFDQGRQLTIPELVPFRLTRDMVDGFGSSGVEGVFRRCAEETLRVLRADSNLIMTILGVFKTDPLYSWTVHPLKLRRKQQEAAAQAQGTARTTTTSDTHTTIDTDFGGGADGAPREKDTVEKLADRALASVARKLDTKMSVAHDVQELITQASDPANLALIYMGWRPWL